MSKMKTPLETVHTVDIAFNEENIEKILQCYDDSALMVVEPGRYANGISEIKKYLKVS